MTKKSGNEIGVSGTGGEFVFNYPFIRTTYSEMDEAGCSDVATWAPGVRFEDCGNGDAVAIADGLGFQRVRIIGSFKPGKYPERVFYTRIWEDPDGRLFGSSKLRIKTAQSFRSLISGYRYPYELQGAK